MRSVRPFGSMLHGCNHRTSWGLTGHLMRPPLAKLWAGRALYIKRKARYWPTARLVSAIQIPNPMKNVLSITCMALLLFGCQKDSDVANPAATGSLTGGPKIVATTFYETQFAAWCAPPQLNCIWAANIVRPADKTPMQNILNVVLTQNDNNIKTTFSNNYALLTYYFAAAKVDAVIAGTRLARSTTLSDGSGTKFMMIKYTTTGNPIDVVYQFSLN